MSPETASGKNSLLKDKKFIIGVSLVVLSMIIGTFGKGLFIFKFYTPIYLVTGLSLYAFSWILLLFGIYFIGKEAMKMIKTNIQNRVQKTFKNSYQYTKDAHKKGFNKLTKTSAVILKKIRQKND